MQRRAFVGATVTTAVLTLAGCSGAEQTDEESPTDSTDDTGSTDDPTDVLERNWAAYRNGRREEYISTYHSDSPRRENEPWNDEEYWPQEGSTFVVESREIVEQTETTATVHEEVRGGLDGNTSRWLSIAELRTENGEWKVWDYEDDQLLTPEA